MVSRSQSADLQPVALITGGGGNLAAAIRAGLETDALLVHAPPRAELDVTSATSVSAFFGRLAHLDLAVCNAGVIIDKPLAAMSPDEFASVLDVNLSGAFRVARAALRIMSRRRAGHIVFIGSFSALSCPAGQSNYASAKAGLVGLAQSLAREYGPRNIRVNCVLPGFLETRMTARLGDALRARVRAEHTLGRFNTPDIVARFIRFLHREMPHTSGQVFSLDSRPHRWT